VFGHGRIAEDRPRSNFSERVAANLPRPAQGPGQDQKGWLLTIHDVQLRQWEDGVACPVGWSRQRSSINRGGRADA
jgi:hypothetical protein